MTVDILLDKFAKYSEITISNQKDGEKDGYLIKASPNPSKGYNWGYLLYMPVELRDYPVLIVEGPAVGEVGDIDRACDIILDKALFELSVGGFPHYLANKMKCPVIMPLFPRPEDRENNTNIFTHALTSRAMNIKNSPIERIDLQLIAMSEVIKEIFTSVDYNIFPKFIIKGFSSGGAFAHRFTILHPEYVLAAIAGGCMHSFTLPLEKHEGELLLWPNGIGNAHEFCEFEFNVYKGIKQFFYMGDDDFRDSVPYNDSYTEEERQQVYRLFGKTAMPDRWNLYQNICKSLGLDNMTFKTYKGLDHKPGNRARNFIEKYIAQILADI